MRNLKLILTAPNPADESFSLIPYQKIKFVISRKEFIHFKYDNICNKYSKKTFTKLYQDGQLILYHRPNSGFKTFCFSSITSLKNNLYSSSRIKYNRDRHWV